MSTDYLEYSANSDRLLNWLKNVGRAYPETEQDLRSLRTKLKALKSRRDEWAHSAAVVDLFLMMKEDARTSMTDRDVRSDRLLNAKRLGHIEPPTAEAVDAYCAQASAAGDEARSLALMLAALADQGVRQVRDPRAR